MDLFKYVIFNLLLDECFKQKKRCTFCVKIRIVNNYCFNSGLIFERLFDLVRLRILEKELLRFIVNFSLLPCIGRSLK